MAEILGSTFVLAVNDLAASRRFYTEKLDFAEELPVEGWSFLRRGACRLRLGHCPDAIPMHQTPDHSWIAYCHVRDAWELYRQFYTKGVEIWHPPEDKPWGLREFGIVTPDGHRVVFGERLYSAVLPRMAEPRQVRRLTSGMVAALRRWPGLGQVGPRDTH